MNDYSFTVGIPFYIKSNPTDLKKAIDSILNQTLTPNKIHLIQDGPINDNIIAFVIGTVANHKIPIVAPNKIATVAEGGDKIKIVIANDLIK